MGMWCLSCLMWGHLTSNTCPGYTTTVYKSTFDFFRNQIGPKRLHECMPIQTANTDSCMVYFLVCWCKGYATHYSMCAAFNTLCNVNAVNLYNDQLHKVVHLTYTYKHTFEVLGFGGALYHHVAASFAHCIDVGIKYCGCAQSVRCSCEFNNCIYLHMRSITERHIILVGQLQRWHQRDLLLWLRIKSENERWLKTRISRHTKRTAVVGHFNPQGSQVQNV